MLNPEVSIITPACNCERTIAKTIESVLSQSFIDWEMIITEDCSTDNTAYIVSSYAGRDERIVVINNLSNVGASASRNKAISRARGRYICFLDSDDYWAVEKLDRQVTFMKENNIAFSYHDYEIIDEKGNQKKHVFCPELTTYKDYLKNNKIGVLTIMLDVEVVGKPYMYNQPVAATVGTWLKILESGIIAVKVPSVLAYYRITAGSLSRNKLKSRYWYWRALRDIMKINPIIAFYYTIISSCNAFKKNYLK
jgi:teichuronic acid biosynthesis glycosyltransferase TuaG